MAVLMHGCGDAGMKSFNKYSCDDITFTSPASKQTVARLSKLILYLVSTFIIIITSFLPVSSRLFINLYIVIKSLSFSVVTFLVIFLHMLDCKGVCVCVCVCAPEDVYVCVPGCVCVCMWA